MHHNARVLRLVTDTEVIEEMRRIDAVDAGIRHMLPKARHYLVKLEDIPVPAALILKEAFLSNGGDATVRQNAITGTVSSTDVLLSGTRKQYQRVLQTLLEQEYQLPEIAVEIEAAIRHFDSIPNVPHKDSISDPRLGMMFSAIGTRSLVMGILNVTPDSFSDGGLYVTPDLAVQRGLEMVANGADIIDIGGESTRPGSEAVSAQEEIDRIVPAIRQLADQVMAPISVDTTKAEVAKEALANGALIVNDISAGAFDPEMAPLVAKKQCPAVLMHIKGTPRDMQESPTYTDLMGEICSFLRERIAAFVAAGADEKMLMIDPGVGFGKTLEDNLEVLRRLRELKSIGRPILVGTSRKSTIGKVLGGLPPSERIEGTAATVALSIAHGADIVRVHDVKEMARVSRMTDAIVRHGQSLVEMDWE